MDLRTRWSPIIGRIPQVLPEPDIIILNTIEDLRTALEQLEEIAGGVAVAD